MPILTRTLSSRYRTLAEHATRKRSYRRSAPKAGDGATSGIEPSG